MALVCSLVAGAPTAAIFVYAAVSLFVLDDSAAPIDAFMGGVLVLTTGLSFFGLGLGVAGLSGPDGRPTIAVVGTFSSAMVSVGLLVAWAVALFVWGLPA